MAIKNTLTIPALLCCLALGRASGATDTPASPSEFLATGKNRAVARMERQVFAQRLDIRDLANTAAKKSGDLKAPQESQFLVQTIDPLPIQSYKVYTPWLSYLKESMVFVIGRLDPNRFKIARWSVNLYDTAGKPVKSFSGLGQPPSAFYWDGRDSSHNPVAVGHAYVPEIMLEDFYGAKVSLPQQTFYLDQFLWTFPRQMRAGLLQNNIFVEKQPQISTTGQGVLRELSFLINQHDAVFVELDLSGPDLDLQNERAEVLKKYFAQENLRLRKIQVNAPQHAAEEVFYLTAAKLYSREE